MFGVTGRALSDDLPKSLISLARHGWVVIPNAESLPLVGFRTRYGGERDSVPINRAVQREADAADRFGPGRDRHDVFFI